MKIFKLKTVLVICAILLSTFTGLLAKNKEAKENLLFLESVEKQVTNFTKDLKKHKKNAINNYKVTSFLISEVANSLLDRNCIDIWAYMAKKYYVYENWSDENQNIKRLKKNSSFILNITNATRSCLKEIK